jgi:DNA polymerase elongation subunit (family B)
MNLNVTAGVIIAANNHYDIAYIGPKYSVARIYIVSLYPNIMLKKNLSAETIKCFCCPNSRLRVPELEYNICEKKIGIIPTSLKIVLDKRAKYKELNNNAHIQ